MKNIKIPGFVYSLLLAILAWAIEYLSGTAGNGLAWAPIAIGVIPMLVKLIEVQVKVTAPPDGAQGAPMITDAPSKMSRFLLG